MRDPILQALFVLISLAAPPVSALQLPSAPSQPAAAATPWPPAGVFRPGAGVTRPRLIKDVKPVYTADAMRAKIQGSIWLEAVVQPDGTVGEVRVTQSLDREHGLDDEAVASLKKWQFTPGMKDGDSVAVLIAVEMTFTLKW